MNWTTEPITEPGYYWLELAKPFWEEAVISNVFISNGFEDRGFETLIEGYGFMQKPMTQINHTWFKRWAGPIRKPE